MSARDIIQTKPLEVQEVLKMYMVAESIRRECETAMDDVLFAERLEELGQSALTWWETTVEETGKLLVMPEAELADLLIERIRKQDVWGKILRGDAN